MFYTHHRAIPDCPASTYTSGQAGRPPIATASPVLNGQRPALPGADAGSPGYLVLTEPVRVYPVPHGGVAAVAGGRRAHAAHPQGRRRADGNADAFTEQLVSVAVDKYRDIGLTGSMTYFASPGSALAGLDAAIDYYNAAETIDGHWFAFIGDPDGKIVGHSDISKIGGDTQDLFGGAPVHAHEEGEWLESESLRVYVAEYDGYLFGSGWSRGE